MKRLKLGDVCAFKTDRGYRIIQWAYYIEKWGRYVKIFPEFYDEKPEDLKSVLLKQCSYIIIFDISRLFRKGILEYWGNYQECIIDPFPAYDIGFRRYGSQMLFIISNSLRHQDSENYIGDSSGSVIPDKYKDVRLLNLMPHPITLLHLLSSDFDLTHFDLFWPTDSELEELKQKYYYLL